MEEEKKDDEVNDPSVHYSKEKFKRLTIFKSFEEEEEDTLRYRMNLTPEERLDSVRIMLERIYAEELKHRKKVTRITIDR